MSENIEKPKQALEDMGVETDEAQGLDVKEYQQLAAKRPRQ